MMEESMDTDDAPGRWVAESRVHAYAGWCLEVQRPDGSFMPRVFVCDKPDADALAHIINDYEAAASEPGPEVDLDGRPVPPPVVPLETDYAMMSPVAARSPLASTAEWLPGHHWHEKGPRCEVRRRGIRWDWRCQITFGTGVLEQGGRAWTRAGADLKATNTMVDLERFVGVVKKLDALRP